MWRMRRWHLMSLLIVLAAAVAVGCGDDDDDGEAAQDGDLPVVRFQGLPADPAAIPLLVMQEEGLDEENGFQAEFVEVDPDAAANTLLIGESDIAMEQDSVTMTLAQQEGQEGVVFWPVLNTMMNVVVPEDSDAQTPQDLVGETVGHFGVDSGTTSVIALMLSELEGIDVFEDYDLREAGPAALPELLKGGEVDAIFDYEPLALRAVLETPGRYLFEPAEAWGERTDGWSPYLTNLAARVDWLEENEDLALAAKEAWVEAVEVIEESEYEIFAEEPYAEFLAMRNDRELNAFIDYCAELPCFLNSWTEEDISNLDDWLELMAENEVLIDAPPEEPVAVILEDFYEEQ